jgi:hypothetical protein
VAIPFGKLSRRCNNSPNCWRIWPPAPGPQSGIGLPAKWARINAFLGAANGEEAPVNFPPPSWSFCWSTEWGETQWINVVKLFFYKLTVWAAELFTLEIGCSINGNFFWQNFGQEPNVEAHVSGAHIIPMDCALVIHVQLNLRTQSFPPIDWVHYGLLLLGMAKSKCVANLVNLCEWMTNWILPTNMPCAIPKEWILIKILQLFFWKNFFRLFCHWLRIPHF